MRKTKIVCTLGPSTDNPDILRSMMLSGMNVARFNFSHGDHTSQLKRLELFRKVRDELKLPIAALLDTKGPEIRLRKFKNGKAFLQQGNKFTLTTKEIQGDETISSISYKNLPQDVSPGSRLLLSDGLIALTVDSVTDGEIICTIQNSGEISDNKSVNAPGVKLSMPFISKQDKEDIIFAVEHEYDFIATSFTRSAQDVLEVRHILDEYSNDKIKLIAKIENSDGVENIDEIIAVSNGIMIARGDMGVEIDFTEIPIIQKNIILKCYNSGKPVITATQMLESMIEHPRPTRAEITDVANAIYDGTSAIMLSGETAAGKYPVEVVRTMAAIANRTETDINYDKRLRQRDDGGHLNVTDSIAHAACTTAMDIGANAIISISKSGETAKLVAKYRPTPPIIACVMEETVARQLNLSWGVSPIIMPLIHNTDELIDHAVEVSKTTGLVRDGDLLVITAGVPLGISGTTNMIKAHLVGSSIITGVGIGTKAGSGKLCVCKNDHDVQTKFTAGDVLVIKSSSNELLDYFREASAVIAEDSGMNSHAAVLGLALGKPVIVGAIDATKKLKDGVRVTVDCERNIVLAMPE